MATFYSVIMEMFDGEEHTTHLEPFKRKKEAKAYFEQLIQDYEPFWENFNTIKKEKESFSAFDKWLYDCANITIRICEVEL